MNQESRPPEQGVIDPQQSEEDGIPQRDQEIDPGQDGHIALHPSGQLADAPDNRGVGIDLIAGFLIQVHRGSDHKEEDG